MKIEQTPIPGLVIVEPTVFGDDRGFFFESFSAEKFAALGLPIDFKQDNHSASVKGVLRGLHFQLPPKPMAKLVRCTKGRFWDVAVDIRRNSPTYRQWFGVELSAENKKMLFIPEGFAHGFYALEDCEAIYKSTNCFEKSLDANLAWNDPSINIQWPLEGAVILSTRDALALPLEKLSLPF